MTAALKENSFLQSHNNMKKPSNYIFGSCVVISNIIHKCNCTSFLSIYLTEVNLGCICFSFGILKQAITIQVTYNMALL